MLHSHVKVWVHLIWSTRKRIRILHRDLCIDLFKHFIEKGEENDIVIEKLNIQPEHVHLLFNLPSNKMLKDIAKSLKGESSRWINENGLVQGRFKWQRGYGGFSVSASQVDVVKKHIENQDEHHKRQTFKKEYEMFLEQYGIEDGNR